MENRARWKYFEKIKKYHETGMFSGGREVSAKDYLSEVHWPCYGFAIATVYCPLEWKAGSPDSEPFG